MTASQERIRVCHVITRLIVGGAQRNTVFSCALVDRERFDSLLITGSETGPEGTRAQDALVERAAALGIRFLGPNCLGFANIAARAAITAVLPRSRQGGCARGGRNRSSHA